MAQTNKDDFREFALVLRNALMMIVRWIEKKYMLPPGGGPVTHPVPMMLNACITRSPAAPTSAGETGGLGGQ